MTTEIKLGVWEYPQFKSFKIDLNLDSTVKDLKSDVSKKLNQEDGIVDLLYCGLVLDDDERLASYGVKSGSTIHIIKKKVSQPTSFERTLTEAEVQQLVVAFRAFTLSSGYRAALQRLARPEVLETIIAATPGLAEDPAAVALIQDPELIVHMADPETVRRVADKHPSLIEAANYIAAHIHEEHANLDSSQAGTSTGYSYSLDALSDDEEMDTNQEMHPVVRNQSYNAITAAQLAAAIANATNTAFDTNSAGMPSTPNPTGNVITNEMFSNAMQQALGASFGGSVPNSNRDIENLEAITRRLQPQLHQMHEMGLLNDNINIRALQATAGDVESAIELVFNGTII